MQSTQLTWAAEQEERPQESLIQILYQLIGNIINNKSQFINQYFIIYPFNVHN